VVVARGLRTLSLSFESAEAFQREYSANLANGGVFIGSPDEFELRERVQVELVLTFCDQRVALPGEVVHRITPEMAQMGAPAGVAVQFEGSAHAVRTLLEPLRSAAGAPVHRPVDAGRRRAPRSKARVSAHIATEAGEVAGHTRDLSQTGVLVSVPGRGIPVGERVRLALTHPGSGDTMEVNGVVVREVESDGGVAALAIEFAPEDGERSGMQGFVEGLQASEHTRRLGGIGGDIAALGVQNLLQMFAGTGAAGTLTLHDGQREGVIGFDGGLLRFVRLGPVSGMKALVRLLEWSEGSFEFHARLDPVEQVQTPLPIDAALLEAMRITDEQGRPGRVRLPDHATPHLLPGGEGDADDFSKVEAAVLDLVRAGFSVERIVSVIPEPDPEVHSALESLRDRGVIGV
jgi:Tfp pilus assembly protein PilZ